MVYRCRPSGTKEALMIDFDKGRRRFVNAAGMVGRGLCLPGRALELFGPLKETGKTKKRRSARSKT